jgi:alpha-tubulin suppressor-like RCC1 family protein
MVGGESTWATVCGIRSDDTLWCWAAAAMLPCNSRCGSCDSDISSVAKQVGTASDWTDVSAGNHATCGLRHDQSLWCWGDNTYGEVGDGTTEKRAAPVRIGGELTWTAVSVGGAHTCAIQTDGTLWCWGDDTDGQLGIEAPWRTEPTAIGW